MQWENKNAHTISQLLKKSSYRQFLKFLYGLFVGIFIWSFLPVLPVFAAPTLDIVYSVDDGETWTTAPTVKTGGEVMVRVYYDNDTTLNISDADITTTLPTGFELVSDSTETCLNPGTTDPTNPASEVKCNDDEGMGGAIDESAVWSGDTLSIAPNAGLYGETTDATSGYLAAGKKKYFNLHQCVYRTSGNVDWITIAIDDPPASTWSAGTNVSNIADGVLDCGPADTGWTIHGTISAVQNLDLLGKRYVNLHQCADYRSDPANGNRWIPRLVSAPPAHTAWGAGTNASNTADTAPACTEPGDPWTPWDPFLNVQALDILNNRYLNLHECVRTQSSPSVFVSLFTDNPPGAAWRTGTNASNAPDTSLDCPLPSTSWAKHTTLSDFQVLDLLDTNRGQGFVEYKMTAPAVTSEQTFEQTADLSGTGTGSPSTEETITVEPDLELVYSTDNGATWTTNPVVEPGGNVLARIFYHNERTDTLSAAQITSTLPTGFTRATSTTKTCLNPGTTDPTNPASEVKCNDDEGMGGVIDEGTVWSGDTLSIAPNAGLYGEATDAASGLLTAGKKKYVNLQQCMYRNVDWITVALDETGAINWHSDTKASNMADGAVTCGPAGGNWTNNDGFSGVKNLDLLGQRYLNLHQCNWYRVTSTNGTLRITNLMDGLGASAWSAGTNSSNVADSAVNCSGGSNWTLHSGISDVQALDVSQNRYINLHQCLRTHSSAEKQYLTTFIDDVPSSQWNTGTNASNMPDTAVTCPSVWDSHDSLSDLQVIDLLDTNRGQGFVEFELTAPMPQTQTGYTHNAALTGADTGNPSTEGTITVSASAGVVITETATSTDVTEGGASDTIEVQLTAPPTNNVTITFANSGGQLNTPAPITFMPSTWDTPKVVTITADDDSLIEGAHTGTLSYETASTDPEFDDLAGTAVTANITDDDTPGANIIIVDDITSEDGDTASFQITLTAQPTSSVTIALSSSNTDEASVPADITVQPEDWDDPSANEVTVTGVDDSPPVGDGTQEVTITTGNVTSADTAFDTLDGSTIDDVTVYNQNNDPPGIAVEVLDNTSGENGAAATVRFRLLSQPAGGADVTIPLSLTDVTEGDLGSIIDITIANADWDTPANNEVAIAGLDDALTDGNILYRLVTGDPTSSDAGYDALTAADVVDPGLINLDDDTAGITITETATSTDVTEGGVDDTVEIVLNTEPSPGNEVVLNVEPQSQIDLGAGDGGVIQLTFTDSDWDTSQEVTVMANDDDQFEGAHATFISYSIDAGATTEDEYDDVNDIPNTIVNITDNDGPMISIIATDATATEDPPDIGIFTIMLSVPNDTEDSIAVQYDVDGTATPDGDYTALSGSTTIPAGAHSASITVDTAGYNDTSDEGDETVVVTLTGTNHPAVSIGSPVSATVTITDSDTTTPPPSPQNTDTDQGSEDSISGGSISSIPPEYLGNNSAEGNLLQTLEARLRVLRAQLAALLAQEPVGTTEQEISVTQQTTDTDACPYFLSYHQFGDDAPEVAKIQQFLREQGFFTYPETTTYFGPITDQAVKEFQTAYADEILAPWDLTEPTGWWYQTTRNQANVLLGCDEGEVVLE